MSTYSNTYSTRRTPQSRSIPGSSQVPNSAGGFTWSLDDFARLDRFLVLGVDGPTYYASQEHLSRENAECVVRCARADGRRTVARIVEISDSGRAPKNSPAIFALALTAAVGGLKTRRLALEALPLVCRTATHLFEFCEYHRGLRGWSRTLRRHVARWYDEKTPREVAFQAVKYQQRNGWSHRDLLRLAHPKAEDEVRKLIYRWIARGWSEADDAAYRESDARLIWAFERAKRSEKPADLARMILDEKLPREAVPTRHLTSPVVWEALLADMPMTAMIRNLATMTRVGLLVPGSAAERRVIDELGDGQRLRAARVHPIVLLSALRVYQQGHGARSTATWEPCQKVVDALDAAFYLAFQNVEPTGKAHLLALDVSGSMGIGSIAGVPGLTPRVASAALALVTMAVEPNCEAVAFASGDSPAGVNGGGHLAGITPLAISPGQRLDEALRAVDALPFGGTDCALPMLDAAQRHANVDYFVVLTDNETWAGAVHPSQALRAYRAQSGVDARLAVVAMTATSFSIADPNDSGMLDVVGFDASTPALIADFGRDHPS